MMFTDWSKADNTSSLDLEALKHLDQFDSKSNGVLVRGVLVAYIQSTPRLLTRLKSSATTENSRETFLTAHNLKSSSDNIGARKLSELCKRLELVAQQDPVAQTVGDLTEEILREASRVLVDAKALLKKSAA